MKFKLFSIAAVVAASLFVISCNDDVTSIGSSVQPDVDDMLLDVDSVYLTAETVSLEDYAVYVRSNSGLLGAIKDEVFGTLNADFMGEFYTSGRKEDLFHEKTLSIDSAFVRMLYYQPYFMGDSINPMGVSVYELTNKLTPYFYADVDPSKYCDITKTKVLGQRFFTPVELPVSTEAKGYRMLDIQVPTSYAKDLYDKWEENPSILESPENLKEVLKGLYITSNLSANAIFSAINVSFDIHYTYWLKSHDDKDSSTVAKYSLPISSDVLQLNRAKNTPLDAKYYAMNKTKTFVKAPAGVGTKITIPLAQIRKKGKEFAERKFNTSRFLINSASFKLKGFTEEEKDLKITRRPNSFLFIDEREADGFLEQVTNAKLKQVTEGKICAMMYRNSTNNTYNFTNQTSINSLNNIATIINHYIEKEPDAESISFILIPTDVITSNSNIIEDLRDSYSASAAILRSDEESLKMRLVFSKHQEITNKN